jgi:hypothetical protein
MGTQEKAKPRPKRTIIALSSFILFLLISFVVLIYLFFKGPHFTTLVEKTLTSRLEKHVEIGSITFRRGPVIVITDLVVRELDEVEPLLVLPRAEVGISLLGLIKREIDRVVLIRPEISLSLEEGKGPVAEAQVETPALPFSVKLTSVEEAEIRVRLEEGITLAIGPVNLAIKERSDRRASVKGDAFVPGIRLHRLVRGGP